MFRAIGSAIVSVVRLPVRIYRACVEAVVATRRFLDERRRHLCAAIVAGMMVVVGVELRQPGESDAHVSHFIAGLLGDVNATEATARTAPPGDQSEEDNANVQSAPSVLSASAPTRVLPPVPDVVDLTEFESPEPDAPAPPLEIRAASLSGTIDDSL